MSLVRTGTSRGHDDASASQDARSPAEECAGLVVLYSPGDSALLPGYPFRETPITIGRDSTSAICINEQAVSRAHARIHQTGLGPTGWSLIDLGSRNGTIVNGRYISEVHLAPFDDIRIGDTVFKFVVNGAERFVEHPVSGGLVLDADSASTPAQGVTETQASQELVGGAQVAHIARDLIKIAPTSLSVIILGETGTGKEVIARTLHRLSRRPGAFQAINCAAIPHNLLESELFGYRRGAFSGADRDKPGLIKLADKGTLFLDEVGDMPLDAQAKLLRVLQSKEVFPLGALSAESVDVRVLCATHRDLRQHVSEGKFRGDLFARLNDHVVRLPALRHRKEDIHALAKSFCARYGRPRAQLTFSFMIALLHYDWPFNVRELESCIKRAVALCDGDTLDMQHLPDAIVEHMRSYGNRPPVGANETRPPPPLVAPLPPLPVPSFGSPSSTSLGSADVGRRGPPTESALRALLEQHHGNIAAVGRALGKERMQVHRWLKLYGIDPDAYRPASP